MKRRLIMNTAWDIARCVVQQFDWDSEQQATHAFVTVAPIIAAGLGSYERTRAKEARRLNREPPEEVSD